MSKMLLTYPPETPIEGFSTNDGNFPHFGPLGFERIMEKRGERLLVLQRVRSRNGPEYLVVLGWKVGDPHFDTNGNRSIEVELIPLSDQERMIEALRGLRFTGHINFRHK